jgi:hypothetical protein
VSTTNRLGSLPHGPVKGVSIREGHEMTSAVERGQRWEGEPLPLRQKERAERGHDQFGHCLSVAGGFLFEALHDVRRSSASFFIWITIS